MFSPLLSATDRKVWRVARIFAASRCKLSAPCACISFAAYPRLGRTTLFLNTKSASVTCNGLMTLSALMTGIPSGNHPLACCGLCRAILSDVM